MRANHIKNKILIIDDEPLNLKLLAARLALEGYETVLAVNGEEGFQKCLREMPDLILLDIMMPGINGFDVCGKLKANPATRKIPVLFISSLSSPEDRKRGFDAGAVDYITKPLNINEVKSRVKTHLSVKMT